LPEQQIIEKPPIEELNFDSLLAQRFGSTQELFTKALEQLNTAKEAIKRGDLTISEFAAQASPFAQQISEGLNTLAGQGSGPATEARGFLTQLQQFARLGPSGFEDIKIPFSSRELADLPEEVLPSLEEINQGIVPIDILPPGTFERVNRIEQERIKAEAPTEIPSLLPGQPTGPTTQIPDPTQPGEFINVPIVGDPLAGGVPQTPDQAIIEAEARRQQEQQRQAFEASRALRERGLQQTGELLTQQRGQAFEQFVPQAAEQLQTKGLLQTSELENVLGREQARLQQASESILGQARIAGTQSEIEDINRILGQRQSLQQSGLERRFSIQDFERQAQLAQQLGAQITPQVGGGGGSRLGGAATGAVGGAASLAGFGPIGAAVGGILGGVGGAASGGGK